MKISARNILKGTVRKITEGVVNAEVVAELPDGQEIVAVVTKGSVQSLGLKEGGDANVIIKATNILLGVD